MQINPVKGRFIGETARSILDIIAHTELLQLPGGLLFIDFEKAFDSIEHEFLYKALECFNFGPSFISGSKRFTITTQVAFLTMVFSPLLFN